MELLQKEPNVFFKIGDTIFNSITDTFNGIFNNNVI